MIHLARGYGPGEGGASLGGRAGTATEQVVGGDALVGNRKRLGDRILWGVTKTFWWTATSCLVLALVSAHQGISS